MPTKGKDAADAKNSKQRTQVRDLPREEKALSKDEQKKIKGGVFGFEPQPISAGSNRK